MELALEEEISCFGFALIKIFHFYEALLEYIVYTFIITMVKIADHSAVIYGTHFPNRVFVGCLPPKATAQDLADFFSNFGIVSEAKVVLDENGNSRRFGFVSFGTEDGVNAVLGQGSIFFLGKKINVGPAVKKKFVDDVRGKPAALVFDQETLKAGGKSRVTYQPIKETPIATTALPVYPEVTPPCCTTSYVCPPFIQPYNTFTQQTIFPPPYPTRQFDQGPAVQAKIHPNSSQIPLGCYSQSSMPFTANTQCYSIPVSYSNNQSASVSKLPVTSTNNGDQRLSPSSITHQKINQHLLFNKGKHVGPNAKFIPVGLNDLPRNI